MFLETFSQTCPPRPDPSPCMLIGQLSRGSLERGGVCNQVNCATHSARHFPTEKQELLPKIGFSPLASIQGGGGKKNKNSQVGFNDFAWLEKKIRR